MQKMQSDCIMGHVGSSVWSLLENESQDMRLQLWPSWFLIYPKTSWKHQTKYPAWIIFSFSWFPQKNQKGTRLFWFMYQRFQKTLTTLVYTEQSQRRTQISESHYFCRNTDNLQIKHKNINIPYSCSKLFPMDIAHSFSCFPPRTLSCQPCLMITQVKPDSGWVKIGECRCTVSILHYKWFISAIMTSLWTVHNVFISFADCANGHPCFVGEVWASFFVSILANISHYTYHKYQ